MNNEFRSKLSWWHLKAKKENDQWIKFLLYYLIFDAYLSHESGEGSDASKLRWFYNNENSLKSSFEGCWKTKLHPHAKVLKNMGPVNDMRPGSTNSVSIEDDSNIEQIFSVIYQIRCNLFHGSKDLHSKRDSQLVAVSGNFLKNAIDVWLV